MPEERGLYPRMALGEQLADFGTVHRLSTAAAQAADEWLERLGLSDRAGARLKALSHGNQQRAQLAAAVIHAPDLLVLDEPFAGLDPLAVRHARRRAPSRGGAGRRGAFSSHQLELVEDMCEDVAIIDHGRLGGIGNTGGECGGLTAPVRVARRPIDERAAGPRRGALTIPRRRRISGRPGRSCAASGMRHVSDPRPSRSAAVRSVPTPDSGLSRMAADGGARNFGP